VADRFGNTVSFLALAAAGALAVLLVWAALPETRDAAREEEAGNDGKSENPASP
jgi:predicted MFS family arabinose efflux permease